MEHAASLYRDHGPEGLFEAANGSGSSEGALSTSGEDALPTPHALKDIDASVAAVRPHMVCRFCMASSDPLQPDPHEEDAGRPQLGRGAAGGDPLLLYVCAEKGYRVCACAGRRGYAHRACFYRYLRRTPRATCGSCRRRWLVAEAETAPFLRSRHWRLLYRWLRALIDLVLLLLLALALVAALAYVVKVAVYAATGRPEYRVFGLAALQVRLEPSPGDLVVGGIGTLALLGLVALDFACTRTLRCYARSCACFGFRSRWGPVEYAAAAGAPEASWESSDEEQGGVYASDRHIPLRRHLSSSLRHHADGSASSTSESSSISDGAAPGRRGAQGSGHSTQSAPAASFAPLPSEEELELEASRRLRDQAHAAPGVGQDSSEAGVERW